MVGWMRGAARVAWLAESVAGSAAVVGSAESVVVLGTGVGTGAA